MEVKIQPTVWNFKWVAIQGIYAYQIYPTMTTSHTRVTCGSWIFLNFFSQTPASDSQKSRGYPSSKEVTMDGTLILLRLSCWMATIMHKYLLKTWMLINGLMVTVELPGGVWNSPRPELNNTMLD